MKTHSINLVIIVEGCDYQKPWEINLLTWTHGHFFQLGRPVIKSVRSGTKMLALREAITDIQEKWSFKEVLESLFEPVTGKDFAKTIANLYSTERLVEISKDDMGARNFIALVDVADLEKIRLDFHFGGFDLVTQQVLLALFKKQKRDNKRDLEKARRDNTWAGMKITGTFKFSDIPERDFGLAKKAFEVFGRVMQAKKEAFEKFERTVYYQETH